MDARRGRGVAIAAVALHLTACAAPIPCGSRSIARLSEAEHDEVVASAVMYVRDATGEPPWVVAPLPEAALTVPMGPDYTLSVGATIGMLDLEGGLDVGKGRARVLLVHGLGAGVYADRNGIAPYLAPAAGVFVGVPRRPRMLPNEAVVTFGGLHAARSIATAHASSIGAPTTYITAAFGQRRAAWSFELALTRTFNDDQPAWELTPRVSAHGRLSGNPIDAAPDPG